MICSLRQLTQLFSLSRKCLAACSGKLVGELLATIVMLNFGFWPVFALVTLCTAYPCSV